VGALDPAENLGRLERYLPRGDRDHRCAPSPTRSRGLHHISGRRVTHITRGIGDGSRRRCDQ